MPPKNDTASLAARIDKVAKATASMTLFTEIEGGLVCYIMTFRYLNPMTDDWEDGREAHPSIDALVNTVLAKLSK